VAGVQRPLPAQVGAPTNARAAWERPARGTGALGGKVANCESGSGASKRHFATLTHLFLSRQNHQNAPECLCLRELNKPGV